MDCAPLSEGHNWQPAGGSPRARRWSLLFYVMTPSGARGSRRQISGLLGAKEGLAWAGLLSGCGVRPGPTQALSHCLGRSGQRSDPPHLPLALGLRNESSLLRGYPGRPRRKPGLGSQETPTPRSLDLSSVGPCLSGHNPARREVSERGVAIPLLLLLGLPKWKALPCQRSAFEDPHTPSPFPILTALAQNPQEGLGTGRF